MSSSERVRVMVHRLIKASTSVPEDIQKLHDDLFQAWEDERKEKELYKEAFEKIRDATGPIVKHLRAMDLAGLAEFYKVPEQNLASLEERE